MKTEIELAQDYIATGRGEYAGSIRHNQIVTDSVHGTCQETTISQDAIIDGQPRRYVLAQGDNVLAVVTCVTVAGSHWADQTHGAAGYHAWRVPCDDESREAMERCL